MRRSVKRASRLSRSVAIVLLTIGSVGLLSIDAATIQFVGTITMFSPPSSGTFTVLLDPGVGATYDITSGGQRLDQGSIEAQQNGSNVTGTLNSTATAMRRCAFTAVVAGDRVTGTLDQASCGGGSFVLTRGGSGPSPGSGPLPTITVTTDTPNVAEVGNANGRFIVTRAGNSTGVLQLVLTVGGTATLGVDYAFLAASLTMAPGQTTAIFNFQVITDQALTEPAETVILRVGASPAYAVGAPNSATVTIRNCVSPPSCP